MDDRFLQRIVVIETVGQGSVGQNGIGRTRLVPSSDQTAFGRPAEGLGDLEHHPAEVHGGRGQRDPQTV